MTKGFLGMYPTLAVERQAPGIGVSAETATLTREMLVAAAGLCPLCERKPIKDGYKTCYRCHVNGFGVNWHGGGFMYGRHNFSARTNAEYVAEHVGDVSNPDVKHVGSLDWKDI